MNKKNIVATLMAVVLFLSVLFSYECVIENAHHDCVGDRCPICLEMSQAAHFLSSISIIPVLTCIGAFLCVLARSCAGREHLCVLRHTLISLKVEMLI